MEAYYNSPIGLIKITGTAEYVSSILFADTETELAQEEHLAFSQRSLSQPILTCIRQLADYFEGKRTVFDFPMKQEGTAFQQLVWSELRNIPFGERISYLELSKRIGNIKAVRAVGKANGLNLLSIVVPCHRVVGNNNKLIGYSGGLERKRKLLIHEENYSAAKGKLLLLF